MSLINQVLQHVEQRHGHSPVADSPWAAQIKPVLSAADSPVKRLAVPTWLLLLIALIGMGYIVNTMRLPDWHAWMPAKFQAQQKRSLPSVQTTPQDWRQQWDGQPQLSKSLSSDWQSMTISKKITLTAKAANPAERTIANVSVSVAAEEPAATVTTSALSVDKPEPVAAVSNHSVKGDVLKQIKPGQEANVLIQRALDHEQKGRVSEAMATLRQAVVQYPQSEDARLLLVNHLLDNKQDNEAVAMLQTGIASHPDQHGLRKALARWQLSHAQPDAALATLKPMLNGSAQDAEWQWMMAMAYQQSGQHAFAVPYFDQALKLQPGQAQWYVAAAMSLQALGQNAVALNQLQTAQNLPMSERMADFVAQRIQQLSVTAN